MLPRIPANLRTNKTVAQAIWLIAPVFVLFSLIFLPVPAWAQAAGDTLGLQPIQKTINLGGGDIREIAGRIITVFLGLLGLIAFGLTLYGGFLIMTSAGNEEKVAQGKKVLTNAVVGLVIIMSTFAIVQFIFKMLGDSIGGSGTSSEDTNGAPQPFFADYSGTGGLGSVIKDHYPRPNQSNVARNTKIVVTFAEPILPSSLITNTNNTCWPADGSNKPVVIANNACLLDGSNKPVEFFGDCVDLNNDKAVSWDSECDQARTDAVQTYPKEQATSTTKILAPMAALAVYDTDKHAQIYTFKPLEPLGSTSRNVWYTVKLLGGDTKTKGIKRLDGSDIFPQQFINKFYNWSFETNTTLDLAPPAVISTRPAVNETIARNTIVKINFSEPVDPTAAQGILGDKSSFTNVIFGNPNIKGEWKITNNYSTLEFVSNEQCGENSCGEPMYCLPVACPTGDANCTVNYSALVRTAALLNPADNSFLSQPFTGLADMAGNALDNGPGNKPDGVLAKVPGQTEVHKPKLPANYNLIGENETVPDNYFWSFKVKNEIDRTVPYITKVTPALEGEGVKGRDQVKIYFSKPMWYTTLTKSASITEYPANVMGKDKVKLDDFAYYTQMENPTTEPGTVLELLHPREFGTGGLDLYYFTSVSSSAKAENQNCLYPGRGPVPPVGIKNTSPVCSYLENPDGTFQAQNCAPVTFDATSDTACVFGLNSTDQVQPDLASCLTKVKADSPSTLK